MRLLLGIIGVVLCAAAVWWWFVHPPATNSGVATRDSRAVTDTAQGFIIATSTAATLAGPLKPPREAPAGYAEYHNAQYHFSLFYPTDLNVNQYDEGSGATTIVFQNVSTGQGFQIYALPYDASQVSQERFRQDEPSGVRQNPLKVSIDGAMAMSFYSVNTAFGDTAEIWFIHGGFLFEVTTYKPLDAWLGQIIESWKFL
jgi:hypothetical protein